ncbi:MAG: hypothetical protein WAN75_00630 [Xanthobacteraceae bacterium]
MRGGAFHPPGIPDAVYSGIDRQCRGRAVAVDRCPIDERKRWATDDAGAAYRVVDIDERGRRQEEGIQGSGGNDAAMPVRAQCDRAVTAQGDVGPDNEFGAVAGRIECDLAAVPESDVAPKYCADLQRGAIADADRAGIESRSCALGYGEPAADYRQGGGVHRPQRPDHVIGGNGDGVGSWDADDDVVVCSGDCVRAPVCCGVELAADSMFPEDCCHWIGTFLLIAGFPFA